MINICNEAGEVVYRAGSDAEACRWWRNDGLPGDYFEETGEPVEAIAALLGLDT